MTVIVRRPRSPLDGLVRAITYRAGEQPPTSVEKILPGVTTSLWINLNRDEFRSFGDGVRSVPGAMLAGPGQYLRSRIDGLNHLRVPGMTGSSG